MIQAIGKKAKQNNPKTPQNLFWLHASHIAKTKAISLVVWEVLVQHSKKLHRFK